MDVRTLYICEKPDQARRVAKELRPREKKDGYVVCEDGVVVTWAVGHVYQPFMPEDYVEDWKRWTWDTLPIIPHVFKFKPDPSKKSLIKTVNWLIDHAKEIVVATDPDREGELIAYEIITEKGYKGPIKRAIFPDLTPAAIRKAIANLEPGEKYKPWYHAALARTVADFIVGINLTRAATLKLRRGGGGKPLSVGRVQTPALAKLVRLERRIQSFVSQEYYELVALVSTAGGHKLKMRFSQPEARRITDVAKIDEIRRRAEGAKGRLSVTHEEKEREPPALLELNTLQQEANARLGWSADKTLEVAQRLYDGTNGAGQSLITYPRGDCAVLPEEHIGRIDEQIKNLTSIPSLAHLALKLTKPVVRSSVYDDTKVTAHTAIVPTLERANIAALRDDERQIYELICRFYLAAHMPAYCYTATKVTLDANGVPFAVGGTVPTSPGWKEAFGAFESAEEEAGEGDEDVGLLPPVKNEEPAKVDKADIDKKRTMPPKRFTEKKLLAWMKNVAAHEEELDAAAKKRLKQTSGIGTPATWANIIKTLKDREYIIVKKRELVPTETGMSLIGAIESAAPDYANTVMTARWEDGLESIAQKNLGVQDFTKAIEDKVRRDVNTIRERTDLGTIGDGGGERKGPFISRDERAAIEQSGIEVFVPYGKNEEAKALGLIWVKDRTCWMGPSSIDKAKLISMGWLNPDGSKPVPVKNPNSGAKRDEIIATGYIIHVPYGQNEEAKALGAVFVPDKKIWMAPASVDKNKFVAIGMLNADGSVPQPQRKSFDANGGGKPSGGPAAGAKKAPSGMIKLDVPFDRRTDARALGAKWNGEKKFWYITPDTEAAPFKKAGFLT